MTMDEELQAIRTRQAAYERARLRHNFPDIDSYTDEFVLYLAERVSAHQAEPHGAKDLRQETPERAAQ